MARKYLGDSFDIHGGGVDLRFPHHENEQAQSRAAGLGFAGYWMHNAWVTIGGEKMSKSLGNSLLVSEIIQVARPLAVRYYLSAAHYRSTIEYHEGSLREAEAAVDRIEGFLRRALPGAELPGADLGQVSARELPAEFVAAMDDDLNVSGALAVIHETVRAGNTALAAGDDQAVAGALGSVRAMLDVLGLDPLDPQWATTAADDRLAVVTDELVRLALDQRQAARERKDYATADAIRDQLAALGVQVEDTADGPRWELSR
jgi:cysteinyl-tRNA synthetase